MPLATAEVSERAVGSVDDRLVAPVVEGQKLVQSVGGGASGIGIRAALPSGLGRGVPWIATKLCVHVRGDFFRFQR